jgi:zinc transporter ZupT
LHNVTEGVGIAAPIVHERPALSNFVWLASLAGGPAILGVWIGAFVFSPLWATVFLAIGIGAIAQVIVEVGRIIVRGAERRDKPALDWSTMGGITAGIAIMYATALVVAA